MAEIIACDMCGKQSPDKHYLYIANAWCQVKVNSKWRKFNSFTDRKDYTFCLDCLPYPKGGDPSVKGMLSFLRKLFKVQTKRRRNRD